MCLVYARNPRIQNRKPHRLSTDVLDDVSRLVDVYPVKIDAHKRARVRNAIEDRRHATAGAAPVRPEIDYGDAVGVDL
jgi:hypothetical protein